MVDITPAVARDCKLIEAYGGGGFRIQGERFRGSVLVFPERVLPWTVAAVGEATLEALEAVRAVEPPVEILILGCGARHTPVPRTLREGLRAVGIAVEAMATGAACRTYNVLLAEQRRVAAALIAVD